MGQAQITGARRPTRLSLNLSLAPVVTSTFGFYAKSSNQVCCTSMSMMTTGYSNSTMKMKANCRVTTLEHNY